MQDKNEPQRRRHALRFFVCMPPDLFYQISRYSARIRRGMKIPRGMKNPAWHENPRPAQPDGGFIFTSAFFLISPHALQALRGNRICA